MKNLFTTIVVVYLSVFATVVNAEYSILAEEKAGLAVDAARNADPFDAAVLEKAIADLVAARPPRSYGPSSEPAPVGNGTSRQEQEEEARLHAHSLYMLANGIDNGSRKYFK
jgi:hypothetical protein